MAGLYYLGAVVGLDCEFRNRAGTLVPPTTVVVTVELPDGTTTTPSNTSPSTGLYTASYAPTQEGTHYYRWVGSGANADAVEGYFTIRKSRVI